MIILGEYIIKENAMFEYHIELFVEKLLSFFLILLGQKKQANAFIRINLSVCFLKDAKSHLWNLPFYELSIKN